MSRNGRASALLLHAVMMAIVVGAPPAMAQDMVMRSGSGSGWGMQMVGVLTDVSPAVNNHDLTEGYLTQPVLMGMLMRGPLMLQGTADLEGITLKRGELDPGIWGEGYVDRRHPHTYLHEAMLTAEHDFTGFAASISAGRGFAPFGSDDPMVRFFVQYPANHHLSQILERWVVLGALRGGPVALEGGVFNGDEPTRPRSLGQIDRFGDSFSGRLTVAPLSGLELSASAARVASPELATGGGLDQRKWHGAARVARVVAKVDFYGLVEYARTAVLNHGAEVFVYTSRLAEVSAQRSAWRISARYENTVRPEEERLANPFRVLRPPTDNSILGRTRFKTTSLQLAYSLAARHFGVTSFVELEHGRASALDRPAVIEPEQFYGKSVLNTLSVGVRVSAGMPHRRMGRYGAAALE